MDSIISENHVASTFVKHALVESYAKIFIVNINTGEFEVYKNDGLLSDESLGNVPDIYTYMQGLVTEELVYPEYATAVRRFTNPEYVQKSVFSGERRIVQSYRRRTAEGDKWVTFAVIAEKNCTPENPTVLFTWRAADSDTISLLDTLPTVSALYDKLIRINLSNNTYEPVLIDADEQDQLVGGVINIAQWWSGYSQNGNIAAEDMGVFNTLIRDGSLQRHFARSTNPICLRYRRKVGDAFRWAKLEIAPSVEYSDDNQVLLLSIKDIHEEYTEQRRSRQELIDNMSRDALTNLFNRLKFKADLEALEKSKETLFTCLYIDVNGLHELNNLLGHQKGDAMLCSVADTLVKYFPDDSVYRIGGDEFVVTSTRLTKQDVAQSIEKVRYELRQDNYEISVGIAAGSGGENLEKIIADAELEMRNNKSAYYMQNGDSRRKRQMNEELEQILTEKHASEHFLNVIANQFAGVYLVDLVSDTLRHIYIPDFFADLLKETANCFSVAMQLYVKRFIKSEYHELFDNILDYGKLKHMLSKNENIQFTYEKTNGIRMNLHVLKVDSRKESSAETIWIVREETG